MNELVLGARGVVRDPEAVIGTANAWAKRSGVDLLVADARAVFGRDHLIAAARHAVRAHDRNMAVARNLGLEGLRYLAARRQVVDAIRVAGLRADTMEIALVVFGEADPQSLLDEFGWKRDDSVLEPKGKDLSLLGITKAEQLTTDAEAGTDLALERVALLDVAK